MKPLQERLKNCILFLQQNRKGYRYSIRFGPSAKDSNWYATVTGEPFEDKSLPHDFISVSVDDLDRLPEAIEIKSAEILEQEIKRNEEAIAKLQQQVEKTRSLQESVLRLRQASE